MFRRDYITSLILTFVFICLHSTASAQMISVNFHADDLEVVESSDPEAHMLDGTEDAGVAPYRTTAWNNVLVGNGGAPEASSEIFAPQMLTDEAGSMAATLTSTFVADGDNGPGIGSWFVGYAGSAATVEAELGTADAGGGVKGLSDNGLFNSYLALNGLNGDGSPTDEFVIEVTGLGAPFTANGYDLIIYSDTDRGPTTQNGARTSVFTVTEGGGAVSTSLTEDDNAEPRVFDGNYILSDGDAAGTNYSNYTIISGLTASSFTLEVTSPNGGRGGISGFQIAVPADGDGNCPSGFAIGDVNQDGFVDLLDVGPFVDVLIDGGDQCEADTNQDGFVDLLDVGPFVDLLTGG